MKSVFINTIYKQKICQTSSTWKLITTHPLLTLINSLTKPFSANHHYDKQKRCIWHLRKIHISLTMNNGSPNISRLILELKRTVEELHAEMEVCFFRLLINSQGIIKVKQSKEKKTFNFGALILITKK